MFNNLSNPPSPDILGDAAHSELNSVVGQVGYGVDLSLPQWAAPWEVGEGVSGWFRYSSYAPAPDGWKENAADLERILAEPKGVDRDKMEGWVRTKLSDVGIALRRRAEDPNLSVSRRRAARLKAGHLELTTYYVHWLTKAMMGAAKRGKGRYAGSRIMWLLKEYEACNILQMTFLQLARALAEQYD